MTKEELIRRIQEGMKTEESAMAIYAKHLPAIVGRSGLPESRLSRMKRAIEVLIEANRTHKNLLASLMATSVGSCEGISTSGRSRTHRPWSTVFVPVPGPEPGPPCEGRIGPALFNSR